MLEQHHSEAAPASGHVPTCARGACADLAVGHCLADEHDVELLDLDPKERLDTLRNWAGLHELTRVDR